MKTLERNTIIESIDRIHNGCLVRVTYKSEVPIKSEFKKQGYHITKITETSGRVGVNYHNIASVIARKSESLVENTTKRTNNYEYVIKNKVKYNTNTEKDYLVLANFNKGHHTKTKYIVYGSIVGTLDCGDELPTGYKDMVQNYYLNREGSESEIRTIAFENILAINNIGNKVVF